jgi:hypothetical protein
MESSLGRMTEDYNKAKNQGIIELISDVYNQKVVDLDALQLQLEQQVALISCYFGEGGWCDSWYTSIHPEKGTFSI